MTKAEEMVLKTVHDLGTAVVSDVCSYMGLSPDDASAAVNSLRKKKDTSGLLEWNGYCKKTSTATMYSLGLTAFGSLRRKAKKLRKGYLILTSRCAYR